MTDKERYMVTERMVTYHREIMVGDHELTVAVYMTKRFMEFSDRDEIEDYLDRCVEDAARHERIRTDAY